jgi:hypothetical protein
MPPYSELVVHGDGPAYYDARNVPHGAITRHIYHSAVTNGERDLYVYTPPGYDTSKKYPVLYLLGGSGELPHNWIHDGRVNLIMDNLLAEERAEPIIIAIPNNQVIHWRHPRHVTVFIPANFSSRMCAGEASETAINAAERFDFAPFVVSSAIAVICGANTANTNRKRTAHRLRGNDIVVICQPSS